MWEEWGKEEKGRKACQPLNIVYRQSVAEHKLAWLALRRLLGRSQVQSAPMSSRNSRAAAPNWSAAPHRNLVGEATGVRPAGLATCSRLLGDRLGGAVPGVVLGRGPAEEGREPSEARSWLDASARGDTRPPPPKDSLRWLIGDGRSGWHC